MMILNRVLQPATERRTGDTCPRTVSLNLSMPHSSVRYHPGVAQRPLPPPRGAGQAPAAADTGDAQEHRVLDLDLSNTLSLSNIRQSLILMEDTIIFALIERAQFAQNTAVYEGGSIPVPAYAREGRQLSLLEYLLKETEQLHGRIRRYTNPDETAFYPEDLPLLVLPPLTYPQVLAPCGGRVNVNPKIMEMYLTHLLPDIAPPGDDRNYGSAALYDVMILQALSRRIHYGKFVAEAKFRAQTKEYTRLIEARDADAIMELLTDRAVEAKVVERVKLKAATFGQDLSEEQSDGPGTANHKIRPEAVAQLYEQWVMPLTKEVEVEYLLQRLDD